MNAGTDSKTPIVMSMVCLEKFRKVAVKRASEIVVSKLHLC
jgi:hypothetical protein